MPSQLSRGFTFIDGSSGNTAGQLHSLVDSGTILPGSITEWSVATPAAGDRFVFYQGATGALKQATLGGILGNVSANGPDNVASLRKLGTAATMAAPGNDRRFPAQLTGIRAANGVLPDTVATAADLQLAGKSLVGITAIDWSAFEVFSDNLTGNKTYTFSNTGNGRRAVVAIKLNAFTPTFPAIQGTLPVLGSGTNYKTYYFVQSPIGITGFCVAS